MKPLFPSLIYIKNASKHWAWTVLAAVVAANWLKPGHDVLVIDAGTCVTYDFY